MPLQHLLHLVIIPVLIVQLQIIGKILRNLRKLDILAHQLPVHLPLLLLINPDKLGKILPATGRHKPLAIHSRLNLAEILRADI